MHTDALQEQLNFWRNAMDAPLILDALVRIAKSQVGVREVGNNAGPDVVRYQQATWLKPGEWPWCSAFVCWCFREWIKIPYIAEALHVDPITQDTWRCRDPAAYGWEKWAAKRGFRVLSPTVQPKPGDVVTYATFSHVGIVVEADPTRDYMMTVEGNTDPDGGREGNGVYLKKRKKSLARKFIRFLG